MSSILISLIQMTAIIVLILTAACGDKSSTTTPLQTVAVQVDDNSNDCKVFADTGECKDDNTVFNGEIPDRVFTTVPWTNQAHPDPSFEYTGTVKEDNRFSQCEGNPFTINPYASVKIDHQIQWMQGPTILAGLAGPLVFDSLLPHHGGYYRLNEIDIQNNVVKSTIIEVKVSPCDKTNEVTGQESIEFLANVCQSENEKKTYSDVKVSTNIESFVYSYKDAIAAAGLQEGYVITYLKDCSTEVESLRGSQAPDLTLLDSGFYAVLWRNSAGQLMMGGFNLLKTTDQ